MIVYSKFQNRVYFREPIRYRNSIPVVGVGSFSFRLDRGNACSECMTCSLKYLNMGVHVLLCFSYLLKEQEVPLKRNRVRKDGFTLCS